MSGLLGEGLLAPTGVRLFGRDYTGLTIKDLGLNPTSNDPLVTQLRKARPAEGQPADFRLARIYGFSYLGNYFKLAAPIVMLVWGDGIKVPGGDPAVTLTILGVDFKAETFAEEVKMWVCDQADISVRIDVSIGTISSLVLDAEMGSDNNITGGPVTARSEIVGRSEVVGRSEAVGRSELIGRSELVGPRRR